MVVKNGRAWQKNRNEFGLYISMKLANIQYEFQKKNCLPFWQQQQNQQQIASKMPREMCVAEQFGTSNSIDAYERVQLSCEYAQCVCVCACVRFVLSYVR